MVLERSVEDTAAQLRADGTRYLHLMLPFVREQDALFDDLLGPLKFPRRPLAAARFGLPTLLPAATLAQRAFSGEQARSLTVGLFPFAGRHNRDGSLH